MAKAFDFKRFLIENFGSPQGLLSFSRAYHTGLPLTSAAVEKWFYRASVPADGFAILLAYLEIERGAPVRLAAYLVGD